MGLARAFLYAGASAVIVALWSVSERSAADLTRELFDRLHPGGTKASHAVQAAVCRKLCKIARVLGLRGILHKNRDTPVQALQASCLCVKEQYGDYFDWGPFVIVGDWK